MKTVRTFLFCASLVPAMALSMDSPPEEPEQENGAGERSEPQRDPTMSGSQHREEYQNREGKEGRKMHYADLDTTEEGFLNSTPGRAVSVENLMGSSVRTRGNNEEIGDVEDILIGHDGKPLAIIVSVGGFLGIGDKDVALSWKNVRVAHVDDQGGWFDSDDSDDARRSPGVAGRERAVERTGTAAQDWSPGDYVIVVDTDRESLEGAPEFERDWDD